MCSVSYVMDQWRQPSSPNFIHPQTIQPDTAALMLQIIAKLEALDAKVNAIDCKLKEGEKAAFKDMLAGIAGAKPQ